MNPRSIFWLLVALISCACSDSPRPRGEVIGVSQPSLDDEWRATLVREMQVELSNYDNLQLEVMDAKSNPSLQRQQIRQLIDDKVDVLVISPFNPDSITQEIELAKSRGIPVIITDRRVNSDKFKTFIGADNYKIGYNAALYAATRLRGPNPRILEIWGLPSNSPAIERHQGFIKGLADSGIRATIDSINGQWRYDTTYVALERYKSRPIPQLVFSHNDMMALAASDYLRSIDSTLSHTIIGVDAIVPSALEAISDGRIDVSFLYPTGGEEVIRVAKKIIEGEPVDSEYELESAQIDKRAALSSLLRNKQLRNYQQNIESKRLRIAQLKGRYRYLENSLALILILFGVLIVFVIFFFLMNMELRRSNRMLTQRTKKEEEQSLKLVALNSELEKSTAQKLQFFTNISHEVRTPLTLIIGPLENLMRIIDDPRCKSDLNLIHKNAQRLLREVNQMLDFRKIENNKMVLKRRTVNIVSFLEEEKSYFDGIARTNNISYSLNIPPTSKSILVDFDPLLMDKVLVNILSNAFKFTPEGGNVEISLLDDTDHVSIIVANSGKGIPSTELPFIFERFYTNGASSGTGIGLHLANEIIALHGGRIFATSNQGEMTKFIMELPKDTAALPANIDEQSTELTDMPPINDELIAQMIDKHYDYTILVVEDDPDIREYLQKELSSSFTVLTASDGVEAMEIVSANEVTVIVSDVMMPRMNGLELCATIKQDINYSHIPFILLTALTSEKHRIYGTVTGADVYIAKPFSAGRLKAQIIRLVETRQQYRRELLQRVTIDVNQGTPENAPESLDDLFLRKLLGLLNDVYAQSDYNVERLSDAMGMSRGHLYRKVKDLTGGSPVEFLRRFRLDKAAQLLREGKNSVSEICYLTGFSSPAYFTKCFREQFGMPPSEFK